MKDPIRITRVEASGPRSSTGGWGTTFSDHMLAMDFHEDKGWYDPRIQPYGPLALEPAAAAFHYGQTMFEGLKAFRGPDGKIRLFRPERHAARLNDTARRLCIPGIDQEMVLESWRALIDVDRAWVPTGVGSSLYVRPAIIATEPGLTVRPATSYLYFVITSPVGAYFPDGLKPARGKVIDRYVRAHPGGVGEAKTGGNYASSYRAIEEAKQEGCTQTLWLDGVHRRYIEEFFNTNVMIRLGDEVITPPLGGTILPGVTRDSALALLRAWGVRVAERPIAIDEVREAARRGTLREIWATGTAAAISPLGELAYHDERIVINGGAIGQLTRQLYDAITGIQYGTVPDPWGWTVEI